MNFFAPCKREYENELPTFFPCVMDSLAFSLHGTLRQPGLPRCGRKKGATQGSEPRVRPERGARFPKDGRRSGIFYPFHLLMFWTSAGGFFFFFGREGCRGRAEATQRGTRGQGNQGQPPLLSSGSLALEKGTLYSCKNNSFEEGSHEKGSGCGHGADIGPGGRSGLRQRQEGQKGGSQDVAVRCRR